MITKFLCLDECYPTNYVSGIEGLKASGKSLWSIEQGYALSKELGGRILYINTEESSRFMLDVWEEVFQKKYDVKPKIEFKYLPSAEEILAFCGIHGNITVSVAKEEKTKKTELPTPVTGEGDDKEETTLSPQKKEKGVKMEWQTKKIDLENSDLMKTLKQGDVTYLVVDSVSAAFNSLIAGGQQNYPLRAVAEKMFFNTFQRVIDRCGQQVRIMTTHHISYNPTDIRINQFHMIEEMFKEEGGLAVGHGTKVMFALEKQIRPHGSRVMYIARYPNLGEFSKKYSLLITSNGFERVDKETLDVVKAEQKTGVNR